MSDILKYKQVNWVDGMKINKNHLINLEEYFTACIIDNRNIGLDEFNYGLIPIKRSDNQFLDINIIVDNQNYLIVKILECHAITPGGNRIEIVNEESEDKRMILKNVEASYNLANSGDNDLFLIISMDPYSRIPIGVPNTNELPLRLPNVVPKYKLHILPVKDVMGYRLGPNMLTVGKIQVAQGRPEINEEYIPPCQSMDAHPKLAEFHTFIDKSISSLEKNTVQILSNINEKPETNVLTDIVSYISNNLLRFISNTITYNRWFIKTKPPIYLFEYIVRMARILKNSFDIRSKEEKEVMLNYFSEHFGISSSEFKQLLDNTIILNYEHTDINDSIKRTEDFMNVISQLFNELSKMELISGKKKKKEETKTIDIFIRK